MVADQAELRRKGDELRLGAVVELGEVVDRAAGLECEDVDDVFTIDRVRWAA